MRDPRPTGNPLAFTGKASKPNSERTSCTFNVFAELPNVLLFLGAGGGAVGLTWNIYHKKYRL